MNNIIMNHILYLYWWKGGPSGGEVPPLVDWELSGGGVPSLVDGGLCGGGVPPLVDGGRVVEGPSDDHVPRLLERPSDNL